MREISLENWIKEGSGFTADSYRNKEDESLLLKLFNGPEVEAFAAQEYRLAADVASLGIPTPKLYEMVSADGRTGILYERILHKKSFGVLCSENPGRIPEYARIFAEQSRMLHQTKCDTSRFPNEKNVMRELVNRSFVREEIKTFLNNLLDRTPDAETCLHGDLQTGNIVMGWCKGYEGREQKPGEADKPYFIDLGTFAYGCPLFDVASLYMSTQVYQHEEINAEILHMTTEQLEAFWHAYAPCYIGSAEAENLRQFEDSVAPYAMFIMILIMSATDGTGPAVRTAMTHIDELYERYR